MPAYHHMHFDAERRAAPTCFRVPNNRKNYYHKAGSKKWRPMVDISKIFCNFVAINNNEHMSFSS